LGGILGLVGPTQQQISQPKDYRLVLTWITLQNPLFYVNFTL